MLFISARSMERAWYCLVPVILQGAYLFLPILCSALLLRLCVAKTILREWVIDAIAIALGATVLWFYYGQTVVYFFLMAGIVYALLVVIPAGRKGMVVGGACVLFVVICEVFIVTAADWHKVRGSFLVMMMKMVSIAFDLDSFGIPSSSPLPPLPHLLRYLSYAIFPATTIFGPFLTYSAHCKYTTPTPLNRAWLLRVIYSLLLALACVGMSVCIMPVIFTEPRWNKWLAAYSTAASFRYSHYFVSLLAETSTLASGLGYTLLPGGECLWTGFRVVHPFDVELPRSLGIVVTSWNLPMHLFLKNYVYKPTRRYFGRFVAVLFTYMASSMLHGLNFQLAAVLLSIGVYAYIESVVRGRLSALLSACIQDRPCSSNHCGHTHNNNVMWVRVVNTCFSLLAMFHLAYLGLMFGSSDDASEGYSMMHTLRKWQHLDFLSHWVSMGTFVLTLVIPKPKAQKSL